MPPMVHLYGCHWGFREVSPRWKGVLMAIVDQDVECNSKMEPQVIYFHAPMRGKLCQPRTRV